MANYKVVKAGKTLLYPDGSFRGGAGYCVDLDTALEGHACMGQLDKLEDPTDFVSPDAADGERMILDHPVVEEPAPKPKPAKKTAKKKAKKKASKKKSSK